jgi:hypothetical protein
LFTAIERESTKHTLANTRKIAKLIDELQQIGRLGLDQGCQIVHQTHLAVDWRFGVVQL